MKLIIVITFSKSIDHFKNLSEAKDTNEVSVYVLNVRFNIFIFYI
ncbi:hypothetical protein [Cronobacter phage vB_CsaM_Cronuts]|nr:hypothetical protein [Cronobacter phage vB_CsaM_Cronuts]